MTEFHYQREGGTVRTVKLLPISSRLAVSTAAVLGLAIVAIILFWQREPVFHGKSASQWIADVRPGIGFVGTEGKTTVYLNNLSEKDRKLLRMDDPLLIIADTNLTMTAEFSPDGKSTISNFVTPDRDTWEANQRVRELGAKAVRPAIALLSKRRSRFDVLYESVWWKVPPSVQRLLPAPKSPPDANRRVQAAYCLGIIGPSAKDALPALRLSLKDENNWVRATTYEAIRKIDFDARPFLPEAPFH